MSANPSVVAPPHITAEVCGLLRATTQGPFEKSLSMGSISASSWRRQKSSLEQWREARINRESLGKENGDLQDSSPTSPAKSSASRDRSFEAPAKQIRVVVGITSPPPAAAHLSRPLRKTSPTTPRDPDPVHKKDVATGKTSAACVARTASVLQRPYASPYMKGRKFIANDVPKRGKKSSDSLRGEKSSANGSQEVPKGADTRSAGAGGAPGNGQGCDARGQRVVGTGGSRSMSGGVNRSFTSVEEKSPSEQAEADQRQIVSPRRSPVPAAGDRRASLGERSSRPAVGGRVEGRLSVDSRVPKTSSRLSPLSRQRGPSSLPRPGGGTAKGAVPVTTKLFQRATGSTLPSAGSMDDSRSRTLANDERVKVGPTTATPPAGTLAAARGSSPSQRYKQLASGKTQAKATEKPATGTPQEGKRLSGIIGGRSSGTTPPRAASTAPYAASHASRKSMDASAAPSLSLGDDSGERAPPCFVRKSLPASSDALKRRRSSGFFDKRVQSPYRRESSGCVDRRGNWRSPTKGSQLLHPDCPTSSTAAVVDDPVLDKGASADVISSPGSPTPRSGRGGVIGTSNIHIHEQPGHDAYRKDGDVEVTPNAARLLTESVDRKERVVVSSDRQACPDSNRGEQGTEAVVSAMYPPLDAVDQQAVDPKESFGRHGTQAAGNRNGDFLSTSSVHMGDSRDGVLDDARKTSDYSGLRPHEDLPRTPPRQEACNAPAPACAASTMDEDVSSFSHPMAEHGGNCEAIDEDGADSDSESSSGSGSDSDSVGDDGIDIDSDCDSDSNSDSDSDGGSNGSRKDKDDDSLSVLKSQDEHQKGQRPVFRSGPDLGLNGEGSGCHGLSGRPSDTLPPSKHSPSVERRQSPRGARGLSPLSLAKTRAAAAAAAGPQADASVQAGHGRLLSTDELAEEHELSEMRERLRMSRQELLVERFHREVVLQEQAHLRKTLFANFEAEVARLKQELRDQELLHKKEKITLRWQQDEQIQELERSLQSEEGQVEAAVQEVREQAEDARLEAEALRRSNVQQKAELEELRLKFREQGAVLNEERQALAKCEVQKRIVVKQREAARQALKAIMSEEGDEDVEEEETAQQDGYHGGQ